MPHEALHVVRSVTCIQWSQNSASGTEKSWSLDMIARLVTTQNGHFDRQLTWMRCYSTDCSVSNLVRDQTSVGMWSSLDLSIAGQKIKRHRQNVEKSRSCSPRVAHHRLRFTSRLAERKYQSDLFPLFVQLWVRCNVLREPINSKFERWRYILSKSALHKNLRIYVWDHHLYMRSRL